MRDDDEPVHYRWKTGRLVACDSPSPRGTTVEGEVTCGPCLSVIRISEILAAECGCRHTPTHAPIAAVRYKAGAAK